MSDSIGNNFVRKLYFKKYFLEISSFAKMTSEFLQIELTAGL